MAKRKSSRRLVVLAVAVMALLLLEAALISTIFLFPGTESRLRGVAASLERAWSGTEDSPGIPGRVGDALNDAYEGWIAPLWREPEPSEGDPLFRRCISCHPDYGSKRKFRSVYMNHPLHAQLGVPCADCHRETAHPNPMPVPEKACADCHPEVERKEGCHLCHSPGSLPHFYLLGAPREGPVECDTCHGRGAFPDSDAREPLVHTGTFDGSDQKRCASCHERSTCQSCHARRHPANWIGIHSNDVAFGGPVDCYTCHTMTWCADRCHTVTAARPFATRPLPRGTVR